MGKPSPEEVAESIENDYGFTVRLTQDEEVESVDPPIEFVVENVDANEARDLAKYVSVRGYQAYLGEIEDQTTGNIPIADVDNIY